MTNFYDAFDVRPFTLWLDVQVTSQSAELNRSYVQWTLRIRKDGNSSPFNNNPSTWSVTIAGQNWSGNFASYNMNQAIGETIFVASNGRMVYHNADGTMAIGVESWFNDSAGLLDYAFLAGSMSLPTIPRASVPTFSSNSIDAGTAVTINTNRASTSFTHTIKYTFGTQSGTIATGVATSQSWTPPLSLLNEIPNATSGYASITLETYNGATLIGTSTVSTLQVKAPASVVPDFTTVTHSEATAGVAAAVGAYVQGVSKLALAITGAAGAYGSTVSSYKIEVGTQVINAASGTTPNPLSVSGTVPVTGTITDSRGRTKSKTVNITVLAYGPPTVTVATSQRALSNGTPNDEGTYIRFDLDVAVASLMNTTQRNTLTYRLYTRPRGASTWTLVDTTTPAGITFTGFEAIGTYPVTDAFDTRVEITDRFSTTALQSSVAVAAVFMHWDGADGVGVGKYREQGRLDVNGDAYFSGTAQADIVRAGSSTGPNVRIDSNDIRGQNNGASAALDINAESGSGKVTIGATNGGGVELRGPVVAAGQLPFAMAAGAVAGGSVPAGGNLAVSVTFPAGRFTQPPIVVVTLTSEFRDVTTSASNITASGFTLNRGAAGTIARSGVTANWVAYQMASGSASG